MPSFSSRPNRRPVTRSGAGTAIAWSAAAAAITIIITRAYLALTGYPQVGGEVFHIAHAVWGGLLLMVGLVLVLALGNRWAMALAAIIGGVGIGLFIDEIGKFITKDNDYFFPLAAPLCYALLAGLGVVAMRVGSQRPPRARDHLYAALELMKPAVDGPLTYGQVSDLEDHLTAAQEAGTSGTELVLVQSLQEAVGQLRDTAVPDESRLEGRVLAWLSRCEAKVLPPQRQRVVGRVLLALLAVVGVIAGPGVAAYAVWQVFGPGSVSDRNSLLGDQPGVVAWTAAALAGVIGTVAAVFAWRAVRQMGRSGADIVGGTRMGIASLMLMLGGVNVLNSYFNQFWVLVDACAQVGVIGLLVRVRKRATEIVDAVTHPGTSGEEQQESN